MLKLSLVFLSIAAVLSAGDRSDWGNLHQLSPGESIVVTRKSGDSLKGVFISVKDESLTLGTKNNEVAVPKADVARVRKGAHRGSATLIGAVVGAGGGAGLGAGLTAGNSRGFVGGRPAVIGGFAVLGVLAGALIGLGLGSRHATVYRAN
jgi:hypothetical protein